MISGVGLVVSVCVCVVCFSRFGMVMIDVKVVFLIMLIELLVKGGMMICIVCGRIIFVMVCYLFRFSVVDVLN